MIAHAPLSLTANQDEEIIDNYKNSFLNYEDLTISLLRTSKNIDIEVIQAGSGEPILFIPPGGCNAVAWRYQFAKLSKLFRVISIHLPGIGRSGMTSKLNDFDENSDLIIEILGKLTIQQPLHLVGWSIGGCLAQHLTHKYPSYIKSLTIVNSTSFYQHEFTHDNIVDFLSMLRDEFEMSKKENKVDIQFKQIRGIHHADMQEKYFLSTRLFDGEDKLKRMNIPTLIIAGARDKLMPITYFTMMLVKAKNIQLHVLEKGLHYIPLFNSDYFNEKLSAFIKIDDDRPRTCPAGNERRCRSRAQFHGARVEIPAIWRHQPGGSDDVAFPLDGKHDGGLAGGWISSATAPCRIK